jgi:cytochrome b6-f complex iron-sulfur subunit
MAEETKAQNEEEAQEQVQVNRREFLNLAWLASLGFLVVDLGAVTYFFSLPRFKEGEFGGAFTLGSLTDLPAVGTPPVNNPKGKFWLTRPEGGGVLALYKVCTHLGCLYSWLSEEDKFRCPCHGSQFRYDGSYIQGPAPRSLDRFVVQAVDPDTGEVIAETDPDSGAPLSLPADSPAIIRVDTGRRVNGPGRS